MKKTYIGAGLILIAASLAKFLNLESLDTMNIAILMFFGAIAWVGVILLIPNKAGPDFKLWKMILKGALGFTALVGILTLGLSSTMDHVENELQEYGISTIATIVDGQVKRLPAKRGRVSEIHYLTIRFKDESGNNQVMETEVSANEFTSTSKGATIKLRYSSRNPDIHELSFY